MSTSTEFIDQGRFEDAMKAIRDDASSTNWLLAGHVDGSPNVVDLVGSGSGGPDELIGFLDEQEVQYGLVRLEEELDEVLTTKFVYIHWMGEGIGFAARGRFGVVVGSMQAVFEPYHLNMETSSLDELTEENILDALGQASGKKSKVLDAEAADSRQAHERSYTGSTPNRAANQQSKLTPQVSLQGAEVNVAADIEDILQEMRSSNSKTNCVALHYPDNDTKNGLEVLFSGEDGAQMLGEKIADSNALFGLVRVTDVVDDIPTVKYIQVTWVGERIKPMSKAKIATQKGEISRILGSAHVSIHASHRSEVTERAIMDRVTAASGSRKL